MANDKQKEPDFYPFRIKDHGWVLKNGASIEEIGNAFKNIVYELVSKDFQPGSIAEIMYNDAVEMMKARSESGRKAANARWGKEKKEADKTESKKMQQVDRKIWGEFANVYLSDDEHNDLIRKVGNINGAKLLIDNFSASLADGSATSSNHYATLLKWMQYRKDKSESAPKSFHEVERERGASMARNLMAKTGMI